MAMTKVVLRNVSDDRLSSSILAVAAAVGDAGTTAGSSATALSVEGVAVGGGAAMRCGWGTRVIATYAATAPNAARANRLRLAARCFDRFDISRQRSVRLSFVVFANEFLRRRHAPRLLHDVEQRRLPNLGEVDQDHRVVQVVIRHVESIRVGLEQHVSDEKIAADRQPALGFGSQPRHELPLHFDGRRSIGSVELDPGKTLRKL